MHGHVPPSPPQPHHFAASAPPEPRKPGMFDELFAMIGREVRQMAEMALNSAITAAKRNISENVPKLVDGAVSEVMPTGHGVAAGCGFLTGLLLGSARRYSLGATAEMPEEQARGYVPAAAPQQPHSAAASREPEKPGIFDEVLGMVGREAKQMAEMALNSAVAAVKRNINEAVPKLVDTAVAEVVPTGHGTAGDGAGRPGYVARG